MRAVVAVGTYAILPWLLDAKVATKRDCHTVEVPRPDHSLECRVAAEVDLLEHFGNLGEEVCNFWHMPNLTPAKRIPIPHGAPSRASSWHPVQQGLHHLAPNHPHHRFCQPAPQRFADTCQKRIEHLLVYGRAKASHLGARRRHSTNNAPLKSAPVAPLSYDPPHSVPAEHASKPPAQFLSEPVTSPPFEPAHQRLPDGRQQMLLPLHGQPQNPALRQPPPIPTSAHKLRRLTPANLSDKSSRKIVA
mmetsp:Transcript_56100/g.135679  ORF Transcript_56100/g.135679 Transcript_56100/m.135679 type:complete len:247 (-) Transcript_56100:2784-3524(-)